MQNRMVQDINMVMVAEGLATTAAVSEGVVAMDSLLVQEWDEGLIIMDRHLERWVVEAPGWVRRVLLCLVGIRVPDKS